MSTANKLSILVIVTILFTSIFGCASQNKTMQTFDNNGITKQSTESSNLSEGNRKIIYHAYLRLIVKQVDSANVRIVEIARKYDGYVQQIGTSRTEIRVKSPYLNNAIRDIEMLGKLSQKDISGEDVTDNYQDLQIRLENAQKARKRYLELLDKAQTVEETLKVEKELERLNTDIDILKGKINRIDHLAEFSTISINLSQRIKPGVLGYLFIGVYKTVKWFFVRG